MKQLLQKIKNFRGRELVFAVLLILVGAAMIVFPTGAVRIVAIVLGSVLALYALLDAIGILTDTVAAAPLFLVPLFFDFGLFLAGLMLVFRSGAVIGFFAAVAGVYLIFDGARSLYRTVSTSQTRKGARYVASLISALVSILFGAVLIAVRFEVANALSVLVGCAFAYEGIYHLVFAFKLRKVEKKIRKDDYIEAEFTDKTER